jgi:hypothetical protein
MLLPVRVIVPISVPPVVPVKAVVGAVPKVGAMLTATEEVTEETTELATLETIIAGSKLVGILRNTPLTDKIPVAVPVVLFVGIIEPENGINLSFCIVPPIAVFVPAGVNVETVPFGMLLPVTIIGDMFVAPKFPVIGAVGAVPKVAGLLFGSFGSLPASSSCLSVNPSPSVSAFVGSVPLAISTLSRRPSPSVSTGALEVIELIELEVTIGAVKLVGIFTLAPLALRVPFAFPVVEFAGIT